MTATALAAKVGLTVAPCHRRLRDLEAAGVIRGYRADIDPSALGLGFEDFDLSAARTAAELWSAGSGLSLGDRACLALAEARAGTAITADGRWEGLGSAVRVIR